MNSALFIVFSRFFFVFEYYFIVSQNFENVDVIYQTCKMGYQKLCLNKKIEAIRLEVHVTKADEK